MLCDVIANSNVLSSLSPFLRNKVTGNSSEEAAMDVVFRLINPLSLAMVNKVRVNG